MTSTLKKVEYPGNGLCPLEHRSTPVTIAKQDMGQHRDMGIDALQFRGGSTSHVPASRLQTARWIASPRRRRRRTRRRPRRVVRGSAWSRRLAASGKNEPRERRPMPRGDCGAGTKSTGLSLSRCGAKKPKTDDDLDESAGQRRRRKEISATRPRHHLQAVAQRKKETGSTTRVRISRRASSGRAIAVAVSSIFLAYMVSSTRD
jgi:hypothetical protein